MRLRADALDLPAGTAEEQHDVLENTLFGKFCHGHTQLKAPDAQREAGIGSEQRSFVAVARHYTTVSSGIHIEATLPAPLSL